MRRSSTRSVSDGEAGEKATGGIQSSIYRGPLTLTIRYYTDAFCDSDLHEQPPVTV